MKRLAALFFFTTYSAFSFACSTFLLHKDGHLVFGRNYDWVTGNGMVMVNYRGVQKTSLPTADGKPISWTSSCGSVTFNQYGKEFPNGGMNERGLVVELMWLAETEYPKADERASLNVLQWIQYQLDNYATVAEVLASDKHLRVSTDNGVPLHYLIADAGGDAATVEFLNGKTVVHRGKDLPYPVLTNTFYDEAFGQLRKGGARFGDNSVDRFAMTCRMVEQFRQTNTAGDPVDYSFSILNKVAQGDFTKWSIVYDITGRRIHFITHNRQQRKQIAFDALNFSCESTPLAFDLNSTATGNVANKFSPLSFDLNKALIEQSARESRSHVNLTEAALSGAEAYFSQPRCAKP